MSCCALPAWPLLVVAAELLSLHAFDPKRELFRIIEISQNVPMHGVMMYLAGGVTAAQPHSRADSINLFFYLLLLPVCAVTYDSRRTVTSNPLSRAFSPSVLQHKGHKLTMPLLS